MHLLSSLLLLLLLSFHSFLSLRSLLLRHDCNQVIHLTIAVSLCLRPFIPFSLLCSSHACFIILQNVTISSLLSPKPPVPLLLSGRTAGVR